jgi:hypothetical protein
VEAADCLGKDRACNKNEECCSGICEFRSGPSQDQVRRGGRRRFAADRKGKKGKNKKGKKGHKKNRRKTRKSESKGGCDCSGLQERCNDGSDCCQAAFFCDVNGCAGHTRCCKGIDAPCEDSCDCCGVNAFCDEDSGRCDDCDDLVPTRQPCETTDDCCFEGDVCASIDPACAGRQGDKQCCVPEGNACGDDCDCCAGLACDADAKTCVVPTGGCAPGEVVCQQPPDFHPCCPAGTTCSQFGCVTNEPRTCPAGADTCAQPLVFCGGPPVQSLDCACYLDLAGNSFCSLGFSCGRECTSDTDCETGTGNPSPGSRCIRCPSRCGHERGVCASPCPGT